MKKRKIFDSLKRQKDNKKISFLLGARQVGKTTLLKLLYNEICIDGKSKGLFLDLDIFSNYEKVNSFEQTLNTLRINGFEDSQKDFFYLYLDEFQHYSDISKIMKNLYDHYDNIKIYASGSSSLKIKDHIQESLAGRKTINTIYPLDFEEYLWFKGDDEAITLFNNCKKLSGKNLFSVTIDLYKYLSEFMIFGGYPEVVLQKNNDERIEIIKSIFDLYAQKDLAEYLKTGNMINVKKLIEYLAVNHGQKIKYEEISTMCSLNFPDTKRYIEILQETYLIFIMRPFFTNKNKELVKIPKIYFVDNGVRNYFINNFNSIEIRNDKGILFENFVISELLKIQIQPDFLKFWQLKNDLEVDIIVDTINKQIPIEVKCKKGIKKSDLLGLEKFLNEYSNVEEGFIINLDEQRDTEKIKFRLPYVIKQSIVS